VIALDAAAAGGDTRIHVDAAGRLEVAGPSLRDGGTAAGRADGAPVPVCAALARRLAPLRRSASRPPTARR
jgi:hypothetical protein